MGLNLPPLPSFEQRSENFRIGIALHPPSEWLLFRQLLIFNFRCLIHIIPGNCLDGKFVLTMDWDNISKRGVVWINCGNKFPIQRVSWNYNEWDREKIGRKVASDRIRKVKFRKDLFFHKTKIHLESSLLLKTFVCIQCQTFNTIRIASSTSILKVHIVHPKLVDMFWLRVCHCDQTV